MQVSRSLETPNRGHGKRVAANPPQAVAANTAPWPGRATFRCGRKATKTSERVRPYACHRNGLLTSTNNERQTMRTNGELERDANVVSLLRRIADALDKIAGVITETPPAEDKERGDLCHEK